MTHPRAADASSRFALRSPPRASRALGVARGLTDSVRRRLSRGVGKGLECRPPTEKETTERKRGGTRAARRRGPSDCAHLFFERDGVAMNIPKWFFLLQFFKL